MAGKWRDIYLVDAYEAAKQSFTKTRIAEMLGVHVVTMNDWLKKKPSLREAIRRGKAVSKIKTQTFIDYVYGQLPEHLKQLLEEIQAAHKAPNPLARIDKLFTKEGGTRARQHLFVHAYFATNYNISQALRLVAIPRSTFRRWVEEEPGFAELVDEFGEYKGDFFEGALISQVAAGETAATIFANRTFNRDRGYGEKVQHEVQGKIHHEHLHQITVSDLDLPTSTKQEVLDAYRRYTEENTIELNGNGQKRLEHK